MTTPTRRLQPDSKNRSNYQLLMLVTLTLAAAAISSSAWAGQKDNRHRTGLTITEVIVNFADPNYGGVDTITIRGRRFGRRPQVTLGSFPDPLILLQVSDTEIVAECPMTVAGPVCPTGEYRLRVTTGRGRDRRIGKLSLTIGTPNEAPALQAQIDALRAQVDAMQDYIDLLQTYIVLNTNAAPVQILFTGVNVHVVNGEGATDTINGAGNLIVGYDEPRNLASNKTGSHNLVVGTRHNYTSYGGAVFGDLNSIRGRFSSVSGGRGNRTDGDHASVGGGTNNRADGENASISGGQGNRADGFASSVSGGVANGANGSFASVTGGTGNTASGDAASVSGGSGNEATGFQASVSGGSDNEASGVEASVSGGSSNEAVGNSASVSGGFGNDASGLLASVGGGSFNSAGGQEAAVGGGSGNSALGFRSSVSGGSGRTAPDALDWAGGGLFQDF